MFIGGSMKDFITSHKAIFVGALITGATPILLALKDLDSAALSDPKTWVVGVGLATVRQVAVYLLSKIVTE
jgi:hypothetical protein